MRSLENRILKMNEENQQVILHRLVKKIENSFSEDFSNKLLNTGENVRDKSFAEDRTPPELAPKINTIDSGEKNIVNKLLLVFMLILAFAFLLLLF